jgi:hypothetical protein
MESDMEMHNRSKNSAASQIQGVNFNKDKKEDADASNDNTYGRQGLDVRTLKQFSPVNLTLC